MFNKESSCKRLGTIPCFFGKDNPWLSFGQQEENMAEFLETTFDKFIFTVKVGYLYSEDDY